MNTHLGRAAVAVTATSAMALSLTSCGGSEGGKSEPEKLRIGLLLPEDQAARYEKFDRPLIEKEIARLTFGKAEVVYANAKQNAATQNAQVDTMISGKVDALIIGAVDSKAIAGAVKRAKDAGIPVVAYDRLAEGPIDAYTSFDNEDVGKIQGNALLEAVGNKTAKDGRIIMMNGSVTDPNAALFKSGAHSVLDGKVNIGKEYDTVEWKPQNANTNMTAALSAIGKDKVVGVYSANDGMAGGIIAALKAAGVSPLPPVTGQDAELAGVQRIVTGEQFMTVYKPYGPEANAAAELAIALAEGARIDELINQLVDSPTTENVPSILLPGISVTRANLRATVVLDGVYTTDEICTHALRPACEELGL
nr:substrate-binding domain-containing protein [Streptomyces xanthophaeus]